MTTKGLDVDEARKHVIYKAWVILSLPKKWGKFGYFCHSYHSDKKVNSGERCPFLYLVQIYDQNMKLLTAVLQGVKEDEGKCSDRPKYPATDMLSSGKGNNGK